MATNKALESAFTALSLVFLFIVGLGLGASSTVEDFKKAAAKPQAVATGFASQYLFMPIMAYILCQIFDVDDQIAIGAILVGASPGGTTSNIFTYWSDGDVALSITMSFLSTIAAFFMLPLWIYLLVVTAYDSDVEIAWSSVFASLFLILVPTAIGLYIRKNNTETKYGSKFIWEWIETGTTIGGVIFLIAALVSSLVLYWEDFGNLPASVWFMGFILQPLGCGFGYFVANALGMTGKDKRTISLETGVQNFTLTIAIINLSFTDPVLRSVIMYPLAYGLMYFLNSLLIVVFYKYYLAPLDAPEEQEGQKVRQDESKESEAVEAKVVEIP